jgi:pimeloyl-ACP methyl ester carboxylesterase
MVLCQIWGPPGASIPASLGGRYNIHISMNCGTIAPFLKCLLVTASFFAVLGEPGTISAQDRRTRANGTPPLQLPWVRRLGEAQAQGVIVFVHGVLGDGRTTWSNGRSYWPELLTRDETFAGQDIYVYEYPSPKLRTSFSLDEVADNLRLVLSTDGVLHYKQITFVSHSMGGLVTRAFIVKYRSQVVPKIRFLAFFATPTTGSPFATLAAIASRNPQFGQMYRMNNPDSYLGPLQSNWLAGHFDLKSYCAYETQPVFGSIKIVEKDSATHLCTEHLDPIDANHINIVKPLDATSTAYRVLKSAFEETTVRPSAANNKPQINISSVANSSREPSPIDKLTALGWTVKPDKSGTEFSVMNQSLPDMAQSVRYFRSIAGSFNLYLQGVKSIGGLSTLRDIKQMTAIRLAYGEYSDLTDLRHLQSITSLEISQVPASDLTPLRGLMQLQTLSILNDESLKDISPLSDLAGLLKLNLINDTFVTDVTAISHMSHLKVLYLRDTNVTDLSPLRRIETLTELQIDGKQVPGLHGIASLHNLKILDILCQRAFDLSPISDLPELDRLAINTSSLSPVRLNLSPLRKSVKLSDLVLSGGGGFSPPNQVEDIEAIGELHRLKRLVLGGIQISNLNFLASLRDLEELELGFMPVSDVSVIGTLPLLKSVTLFGTGVIDIAPLLNLTELKKLNITNTPARSDVVTELERRGVKVQR